MRSWLEPAVELRLGKIRRRLAQDLVGLTQLAHLALQRADPLTLVRARTGALSSVALHLAHPGPQRLRRAADLARDRTDRCPLRGMLAPMLVHHTHGRCRTSGENFFVRCCS